MIIAEIFITGTAFASSLVGMALFVLVLILVLRKIYARQNNEKRLHKYGANDLYLVKNRNKYPEVDAFSWRSTFFKLSLSLAILFSILAFSWTEFEPSIILADNDYLLEEIWEVEPPRTIDPPPPPPPPPAPPIEPEIDEDIIEDEEPEFVDQSITEDTPVTAPAPKPVPPESDLPLPPPPEPEDDAPAIFKFVQEMPRFPGCEDLNISLDEKQLCAQRKMLEFIYSNIKYPAIARENGVQGTCVVRFVVNREGHLDNIELLTDIGAQCGAEALRVVELMNTKGKTWQPGMQRGRKVNVQFNLPIRFRLE